MVSDTRMGKRKRIAIGIAVAIVALLALATTAIAAGPGIRGFAAGGSGNTNGAAPKGVQNFGPRAVVTAIDATNQTITLGGLPSQIATVKVDQNVKLVAIQPDGTTKPAAFGDFTVGSLVDVHVTFNGDRPGRGKGQPGNNGQGQPSTGQAPANTGQAMPNATVTELALAPAGQVRIEGLVTSTTGGIQIIDGGGLQLTVNATGATVTKGPGNTAASATDIKVGDRIAVGGTQSGATVNATTIRIADLSALGRRGTKPGTANAPAGSPPAKP
ncbi:MAG: hypothetical protein ACR2JW_03910 [Thermomicrobiales bacterium]